MPDIGEKWRSAKAYGEFARLQGEAEKVTDTAAVIIRSIPKRMKRAIRKEEASIDALRRWLSWDDVPGAHDFKVDALASKLNEDKRCLRPYDLISVAKLVCEWCEENGLECFLKPIRIPLNDFEYEMRVRPKQ